MLVLHYFSGCGLIFVDVDARLEKIVQFERCDPPNFFKTNWPESEMQERNPIAIPAVAAEC